MAENIAFDHGGENPEDIGISKNSIRLDPTKPTPTCFDNGNSESTTRIYVSEVSDTMNEQGPTASFEVTRGKSISSRVKESTTSELLYTVEDLPSWSSCCLLGFQHYLLMVASSITVPYILAPLLCIGDNDPARSKLICTTVFTSGVVTLLQATFGVRLPIVQGGTFAFLIPTIAFLNTAYPKCEDLPLTNMTADERQELWQDRMNAVSGAVIVAGVCQMLISATGLLGLLLPWITPLTIVPTICLIGLTLFDVASSSAATNWGIAALSMVLMILFSEFLKNIPVPFPTYNKESGLHITWVYVFQLFSVLLAVLVAWFLCWMLTVSGALAEDDRARTDMSLGVITDSPWIYIPYPGQWGRPTFSLAAAVGMVFGMLASVVESVGDYYSCARIAGARMPPNYAMNRGIFMEGLGCVLTGLCGTGNGTTSYSTNIAAIGITKVGSNRVVQCSAVFMMLFGIFGKFGAVFVIIPTPVIGGLYCILFAMIVAIGISSLQYVDLNSTRNLFIIGFSIFMGLTLSKWMSANSGSINTGVELVDQLLTMVIQNSLLVGGFLGCFLDNIIPGSPEERGLVKWKAAFSPGGGHQQDDGDDDDDEPDTWYHIPFCTHYITRFSWSRYIPICHTFKGFSRKRD